MENHRVLKEHPLRHLGRCLTQNTEFLQVVQVAQERKKADAGQNLETEWDLDLSSLDLFSWLSEEDAPDAPAAPSTAADSTAATAFAVQWTAQQPAEEAVEHFRLFRGLWRLLELQDLPRAMEALMQVVQFAGQQRYSLPLLLREVESLLLEVESQLVHPWACPEGERPPAEQGHGVGSSACSTTSTGFTSEAGSWPHVFFAQETAALGSDSDLSGTECCSAGPSADDDPFDPQDLHAWELQFICVAAAEDLWRALRSQDLARAMQVVVSLRDEILQVPLSPSAR